MFPSSSQGLTGGGGGGGGGGGSGLTRYASAPSALLTAAVGSTTRELMSTVGFQNHLATPALFFPSETFEAMTNQNDAVSEHSKAKPTPTFQPSFGGGGGGGASSSSALVRHNSSPPGLINQLATAARDDNHGYSIVRDTDRVDHSRIESRMNSELNFSTQQETLSSRIFKETENGHRKVKHSYIVDANVGMRPWDDTHPMMFSVAQSKHDVLNSLDQSQFQFSLGMASMEKPANIVPQDSIPCKIRAKRGCATHPRSIAERERRTRISGKLKKLHELVPNMDKQTSYADMLDLAVQHIKTLQDKVQKLNSELEYCTCGCNNSANS